MVHCLTENPAGVSGFSVGRGKGKVCVCDFFYFYDELILWSVFMTGSKTPGMSDKETVPRQYDSDFLLLPSQVSEPGHSHLFFNSSNL